VRLAGSATTPPEAKQKFSLPFYVLPPPNRRRRKKLFGKENSCFAVALPKMEELWQSICNMEKFESQQYRDDLAEEIKNEPDKEKRKEILAEARGTEEYEKAKNIHKLETQKEEVPRAEVDIFYMRHGKPEGKYAHQDMPYEELLRAISYEESVKLRLSESGRERVRDTLEESGIEDHGIKLILASPYLRTIETAEIIQGYLKEKTGEDLPVRVTKLLEEVEMDPNTLSKEEYEKIVKEHGFWQAMNEFTKRWMHDENAVETAEETYKRAVKLLKYLRRIRKWTKHDRIFMVSHGWFGRVIKHVAQGGIPEDFEKDTKLLSEAEMYAMQHREDDQFIELEFKNNNNNEKER